MVRLTEMTILLSILTDKLTTIEWTITYTVEHNTKGKLGHKNLIPFELYMYECLWTLLTELVKQDYKVSSYRITCDSYILAVDVGS